MKLKASFTLISWLFAAIAMLLVSSATFAQEDQPSQDLSETKTAQTAELQQGESLDIGESFIETFEFSLVEILTPGSAGSADLNGCFPPSPPPPSCECSTCCECNKCWNNGQLEKRPCGN